MTRNFCSSDLSDKGEWGADKLLLSVRLVVASIFLSHSTNICHLQTHQLLNILPTTNQTQFLTIH